MNIRKSFLLCAALPAAFVGGAFADTTPVKPAPASGAPHDSTAKAGVEKPDTAGDDYELRGFFGVGDNLEVSLRLAGTDKSGWYRVGKKTGGVLVEKADAKAGSATLVVNGLRRTLRLAGASPVKAQTREEWAKAMIERIRRASNLTRVRRNFTPVQMKAMDTAMSAQVEILLRDHPEYLSSERAGSPEAKAAILGVIRAGFQAGAALPGADGKPTGLPADFDLATQEFADARQVSFGSTPVSSRQSHPIAQVRQISQNHTQMAAARIGGNPVETEQFAIVTALHASEQNILSEADIARIHKDNLMNDEGSILWPSDTPRPPK